MASRTIGCYAIGKTIGRGTFGKVKLGIHTPTGEKVAIKILVKHKICDVADVERVAREIHILKLIRHPNIIQLYEVTSPQIIETSKRIYLIMEYANGGELFDYIVNHSKIKEDLACKFYQQLIAGIEYTHKLGVVHRDLKPENLLLDHNTNIKVVDFGLSNTYSPGELLKTACGSPCYAAPEMIAGKKYDGLKADIWSSGVILFAMVCGYLPFEDPDTSKLYKAILAGDFEFDEFISSPVKDLISGILNTDPEKRLDIAAIRQHPWFTKYQQTIYPGILVGYEDIIVDAGVLQQLTQFNYDVEHTRHCIEANKHDSITAAYYLLLKKHTINDSSSGLGRPKVCPSLKLTAVCHTPHPPLLDLANDTILTLHHRRFTETLQPPQRSYMARSNLLRLLKQGRATPKQAKTPADRRRPSELRPAHLLSVTAKCKTPTGRRSSLGLHRRTSKLRNPRRFRMSLLK